MAEIAIVKSQVLEETGVFIVTVALDEGAFVACVVDQAAILTRQSD
jgi:hypothetical protein